ncbi:MAG: hypothetical protein Q7T83_01685 [Thermodesulfovibrionales bacterium]|nr:hypothetical protein [Thermodesulfovibrionales bacterium]
MDKSNLNKKLCANLCSYYKPSKEEHGCRGFIVIESLTRKGREIPFSKSKKKINSSTEKKLIEGMCVACSFYEDGCDFAAQKRNALPCGGFILLGHLTESGVIPIDDIVNIH